MSPTSADREPPPPPPEGWIDLHSHVLPGIDDGARDEATSLEMIRGAGEAGTRVIAATSHFPWEGRLRRGLYEERFADARRRVEEAGIPVRMVRGGDLRLTPDLVSQLAADEVPAIAGTRYFLLEFDHAFVPSLAPRFVEQAVRAGFVPVITHPERNAGLQRRPNRLLPMIEAGALSQITAASFTGRFGGIARRLSEAYLAHGCAHLVASDAHGVSDRTTDLRDGLAEVARLAGEDVAIRLGAGIPGRILRDEPIDPGTPTPLVRSWGGLGPWK